MVIVGMGFRHGKVIFDLRLSSHGSSHKQNRNGERKFFHEIWLSFPQLTDYERYKAVMKGDRYSDKAITEIKGFQRISKLVD